MSSMLKDNSQLPPTFSMSTLSKQINQIPSQVMQMMSTSIGLMNNRFSSITRSKIIEKSTKAQSIHMEDYPAIFLSNCAP